MPYRPHWIMGLFLAQILLGAEVPVYDLTVVTEARPSAFAFTWNRDGATRHGDDAFDHAWATGLGLRRGFGQAGSAEQWLLGGDLLWIDEAFGSGGRTGPMLRGEGGWGHGLTDDLLFSATVAVGVGRMDFRLPGGIFGNDRLPGTLLEGGPRLGLRWTVEPRLAVGLQAGWLIGRDHHTGDGISLDLKRSDGWIGLSCAWVIDPRARRVE
jgi:hypothetical protein